MHKILIVDDEIEILEILNNELEECGFMVYRANSGETAIEILKKNIDINIVVSDFRMPNGDGRFLLDYVDSMENKLIFYFLSTQAEMSSKEAVAKGVQRVFTKPHGLNLLLRELKELYSSLPKV